MNSDEEKEAVEWLKDKLIPKQPPKGQYRGPFSKGLRVYVPCPICTQMARGQDPKFAGIVGTAKATQRQHMKDHKLGFIRKPTPVPAKAVPA